ncbi:MAG: PilN domain-containing protein [Acidobacteria bacterium]|nr:PilN domain-containing protein [Acidobacteriota bacterium]
MIKVNLSGAAKQKTAKAGVKISMPATATPILLIAIVLGFAGGGYWWYSSLAGQLADLTQRIQQGEAQIAKLETVIKLDSIFESRKAMLEKRVKLIEELQRNQISPVVALDKLSEAVDNTEFVWLNSLEQNNAVFSIAGVGTSYEAVGAFQANLRETGYFTNFDLPRVAQAGANNFTFSIRCEFVPPRAAAPAAQPAPPGGK